MASNNCESTTTIRAKAQTILAKRRVSNSVRRGSAALEIALNRGAE